MNKIHSIMESDNSKFTEERKPISSHLVLRLSFIYLNELFFY